VGAEAEYAARRFDVQVHLLVLDSSPERDCAAHAEAVRQLDGTPNVVAWHLDEARQRDFLRRVIDASGVGDPDRVLDLMLPAELSYGACTNRAFLIAAALGCESVHRRDSDSSYQVRDGETVFPIHHELLSLGRKAADAVAGVTETVLEPEHLDRPVVLVGSSFVGELSVDISEIRDIDPEVYYDVVSLWAPDGWPEAEKRKLVDESFVGAGTDPFTRDRATLTVVDPMRIDMCNIGFHRVHEEVPLPPATDTIGSDYFLMHLVHDAGLPGVEHNRNIVNFYTAERRTDAGFAAYQLRLVKFFLSMLYLHAVYDGMAAAGSSLLDADHRVRVGMVGDLVRRSTELDDAENVRRLDSVDRAYRKLGGRYAAFADTLLPMRSRLLAEARRDMADFALLIDTWRHLVDASRATGIEQTH
jgi:hypothetical protein